MAIPRLIPSLPQLAQPLPRSLFVLQAREGADRLVERLLGAGEILGGVGRSALDGSPALDPCDGFLHGLDDGLLRDRRADRGSLRAVPDRRAAVEAPAALARPDDHPRSAG